MANKNTSVFLAAKAFLINIILISASIFISVFCLDSMLFYFGFSADFISCYCTPNVKQIVNNIEYNYEFRTNSKGLRYKELPFRKGRQSFRVFVLGDSFTEGVGVNSDQTFCSLLENKFNSSSREINFINGGKSGIGPVEYKNILSDIGLGYEPDAVLICLYANDTYNINPYSTGGLFKYDEPKGVNRVLYMLFPRIYISFECFKIKQANRKLSQPADLVAVASRNALRRGILKSRIDSWRKRLPADLLAAANKGEFSGNILAEGLLWPRYWTDSLDIDNEVAEKKCQGMFSQLNEIAKICRVKRIEVAVVFIPDRLEYDPAMFNPARPSILQQVGVRTRKEWLINETELQKRLKAWALSQKLPFLDLTVAFRGVVRQGYSLTYSLDGHLTSQGHLIAAEEIYQWLNKENVFRFARQ